MSFPYALDVVFGSEHATSDSVIAPKIEATVESDGGEEGKTDDTNDDGQDNG